MSESSFHPGELFCPARAALRGRRALLVSSLTAIAFASLCQAGQTRTWTSNDYSDFEKGNIKKLSLRSDGQLTLAPRFQELFDSSSTYLWTLARDSKGNLYTGGGPGAKLYRISPKGNKKVLAELDGMEIHAIAVNRKDEIFAATSPDSKIYRVSSEGKATLFYDPKAKYVWAMAFDSKGNLFVATGDEGRIYCVSPEGKGRLFYATDETHARSMVLDGKDNLIVGTDPGGLVIRISPAGEGFVLYQMPKKEVTAVAVGADGSIYASGVGTKQPSSILPSMPIMPVPAPSQSTVSVTVSSTPKPAPSPAPTMAPGAPTGTPGGSEVYRIATDGRPAIIWNNSQDIVYALAFDANGHLLLGCGNKGYIYRVDSDTLSTALLNAPPTQVTSLLSAPDGKIYAATGNIGKVYQIGPGLEQEGTIESDVFDAGMFTEWGRLSFKSVSNGGRISIVTRSGNLDQPQKSWSPWSAAIDSAEGARITSPSARFVQWKATFSDKTGQSPELKSVDVAYLPMNVAPRIQEIDITPPNYRFPAASAAISVPQTLNLPPLGKRTVTGTISLPSTTTESTPGMNAAKGFIGARWLASDENGDSMVYTVEIRGIHEKEWKLLKDKVKQKYLSWDSTAFADGEYQIRVTASDLPGNPPAAALTSDAVSESFLIDNTPPQIAGLAASPNGAALQVRWNAADALSNIEKAEYSLDGGEWMIVPPVTRLSDSRQLSYDLEIKNASAGEHTIAVRVSDEYDNQATAKVIAR